MNRPITSNRSWIRRSAIVAAWSSFVLLARGDWQRTDTSVAWREGTNVLWQFNFDLSKGKPFFHPLSAGGAELTNFKPEDHPWHYGLWFSWKYINKANYWEEDQRTGLAQGKTRWTTPSIDTRPDGSAVIVLDVTYTHPSGRVDLSERRELNMTVPGPDGSFTIDWKSRFTAGSAGAELDRTPMPNEPGGQINGGYAGLGLRMASAPLEFSALCSTGAITRFTNDRSRPTAAAVAFNFRHNARDVGGIAIFSDGQSSRNEAPWYIVNSQQMRFGCAAVLAPKIITLASNESWNLHYQIAVRSTSWTVEALQAREIGRGD